MSKSSSDHSRFVAVRRLAIRQQSTRVPSLDLAGCTAYFFAIIALFIPCFNKVSACCCTTWGLPDLSSTIVPQVNLAIRWASWLVAVIANLSSVSQSVSTYSRTNWNLVQTSNTAKSRIELVASQAAELLLIITDFAYNSNSISTNRFASWLLANLACASEALIWNTVGRAACHISVVTLLGNTPNTIPTFHWTIWGLSKGTIAGITWNDLAQIASWAVFVIALLCFCQNSVSTNRKT